MDWAVADRSLSCRVSPFRYLRINVYLPLPAAFRSLSRLSSALSAKASTLRSYCFFAILVIFGNIYYQHLLRKCRRVTIGDRDIRCLVLVYNISFTIAPETSPCADLSDPCIDHYQYSVFKVQVGLSGLEPPTSRLSGVRSNRLSYKPINFGAHLLSHFVSKAVPSAVQGLTIVFGMRTGVSPGRISTKN